MIDVSEVMVDPDFMQSATRRRGTRAFALGGEGEIGTSYVDAAISVSIQPIQAGGVAAITALLPEGQRGSGALFTVFSSSELRVDDGANGLADVVTVGARSFKIVRVDDWAGNGFYQAVGEELAL